MKNNQFLRILKSLLLVCILALSAACGGGGGGGVDNDNDNGSQPISGTGVGAGGVPIFWQSFGDPSTNSGASSVLATPDGGYIAAGGQLNAVYLVKIDAQGNKQWERTFGGGGGSDVADSASCIRKTSDGGYIIAGLHRSGIGGTVEESRAFYLIRTDANGNTLPGWPKSYKGSSPKCNGAYAVLESKDQSNSPDGFVFVGSSTDQKAYIIKVSIDGNTVLWSTKAPHETSPGLDGATAIVQNADRGYTVAGWSEYFGVPNHVRVFRTDAQGNIMPGWPKIYDQGSAKTGTAYDIKNTQDGGFILAGTTSTGGVEGDPGAEGDALVIKVDNQGNEAWRKTFGGNHGDAFHSIAITSDGGYIAAGSSASFSTNNSSNEILWNEVYLVRLDSNGNLLWQKAKGIAPDSSDGAGEVQQAGDGGYVIAGSSQNHFLIAKMDANGDTVNLGQNDFTYTVPNSAGTINISNAKYVSSMGLSIIDNVREVGAFGLDLLIAVKNNPSLNNANGLSISPEPISLASDQTYAFTLTDYSTTYSGDQAKLNGALTLKINTLTGNLSGDYTTDLTVSSMDVTHEDDAGTPIEFKGGLKFTRTISSGNIDETTQNNGLSATITITSGSKVQTVKMFTIRRTQNSGGIFNLGIAGDSMKFELAGIPGTMILSVINPIAGNISDSIHPSSGKDLIKAADNSFVRINISTGGAVQLEVDTNADGTIDGSITTSYDELS